MSTFEKFEDIEAWKKARTLTQRIYIVTAQQKFAKDFSLKDQIRRAAISVMLNIAEGFGRKSGKEFSQYLFIAHGSVTEVQSALYVALDQQYLGQDSFNELYNECLEISKMLSGLIKYLRLK